VNRGGDEKDKTNAVPCEWHSHAAYEEYDRDDAAGNPLAYVDPTGLAEGCATATCDPRNEAAYAATSTTDPVASYGAWLEASQSGRTPPSGWEKYADFAVAASRQTGVSAGLILGVMATETGGVRYNPSAIGTSGEIGLMQVMPSTAGMYGVTRAQLFDPATNILTGARYLADLLRSNGSYRDQLIRAISAYNQGPGNLARKGVGANRGYWSLVLSYMDWFRRLYP
jgi:soluble lytic murein transglycosylase-like protein